MIVCPNCGYVDKEKEFPRHPEMLVEDGVLHTPIIVCPNCKGGDIMDSYIEIP